MSERALTGIAKLGEIVFSFYRREQGLRFENQFGRDLTLETTRLCRPPVPVVQLRFLLVV